MNTLEAIHTRRSIRKYTEKTLDRDVIDQALRAAMTAPSAGNAQPWQFVVVTDRDKLDACAEAHPHAKMAKSAQAAVLVCGDLSLEKYAGFWVQDCSAAIQNFLLAAHDQGAGCVWTGIHPVEERVAAFKKLFGLPEGVVPMALIVMGDPAQEAGAKDRYKAERVHENNW